jgi:hypothetical protein
LPGDKKTTPAQAKALNELIGLVGESHVGGRTLCCLIGGQGSGKTWLAEHMASLGHFGQVRYVSVNDIVLDLLAKDPVFAEVFDFNSTTVPADLKRYGNRLRKAVHDLVAEQLLPEGLTIIDHLELVFALHLVQRCRGKKKNFTGADRTNGWSALPLRAVHPDSRRSTNCGAGGLICHS